MKTQSDVESQRLLECLTPGTVRRNAERLTHPSVQAHPELFTPDGCGSPLPGRTMPPAPRPRVRAARAAGLSFLRGLVCEPEVVVSRIPFARAELAEAVCAQRVFARE